MSDHSGPSREALSALVDGQARPDELSHILNAWKTDAETREAWCDYQFVGDVMRSAELAQGTDSHRFLEKLRANLAQEPVVLAPAAAARMMESAAPSVTAPGVALRRRTWAGPTAVAAGFVMVVGAMVSMLSPISSVPAEALASAEQTIYLVPQDSDSTLDVAAAAPVQSTLMVSDALMPRAFGLQSTPDLGGSFSRPRRASALLVSDPRLDHALGIRRGAGLQDGSFASQHALSQQVVYAAP